MFVALGRVTGPPEVVTCLSNKFVKAAFEAMEGFLQSGLSDDPRAALVAFFCDPRLVSQRAAAAASTRQASGQPTEEWFSICTMIEQLCPGETILPKLEAALAAGVDVNFAFHGSGTFCTQLLSYSHSVSKDESIGICPAFVILVRVGGRAGDIGVRNMQVRIFFCIFGHFCFELASFL